MITVKEPNTSKDICQAAKAAMDALGVSEEEGHLITLAVFVRTLRAENDALRERLHLYQH